MSDNEHDDLRQAFDAYQPAPKDIVPRTPDPDAADLPTGPQPVTWHEVTEDGITTHHDTIWIAKPVGEPDHD